MDPDLIFEAIKELREQRDRLDQVIKSLEGLAQGKPRRGRPPKFLAPVVEPAPKKARKKRL